MKNNRKVPCCRKNHGNVKSCLFKDDVENLRKIGQPQDLKSPLIFNSIPKPHINYETIDNSLQDHTIHEEIRQSYNRDNPNSKEAIKSANIYG